MALSNEDRIWMQGLFDNLGKRVDETRREAKEDLAKHEEVHHNPVRTWGVVTGVVAALTLLWEFVKFFFRPSK